MGVSFETCLRRRGDVMVGCRCYVLLRRRYDVPIRLRREAPQTCLGNVPSRRRCVFHLRRTCDVAGTYREMSLRRRHNVLMPGGLSNFDSLSLSFFSISRSNKSPVANCHTLESRKLWCLLMKVTSRYLRNIGTNLKLPRLFLQ